MPATESNRAGWPRPQAGRKLLAILINGVLLIAAGAAALGIAELTVRAFAPQKLILKRPDIWQPTDTLGRTHRPPTRRSDDRQHR